MFDSTGNINIDSGPGGPAVNDDSRRVRWFRVVSGSNPYTVVEIELDEDDGSTSDAEEYEIAASDEQFWALDGSTSWAADDIVVGFPNPHGSGFVGVKASGGGSSLETVNSDATDQEATTTKIIADITTGVEFSEDEAGDGPNDGVNTLKGIEASATQNGMVWTDSQQWDGPKTGIVGWYSHPADEITTDAFAYAAANPSVADILYMESVGTEPYTGGVSDVAHIGVCGGQVGLAGNYRGEITVLPLFSYNRDGGADPTDGVIADATTVNTGSPTYYATSPSFFAATNLSGGVAVGVSNWVNCSPGYVVVGNGKTVGASAGICIYGPERYVSGSGGGAFYFTGPTVFLGSGSIAYLAASVGSSGFVPADPTGTIPTAVPFTVSPVVGGLTGNANFMLDGSDQRFGVRRSNQMCMGEDENVIVATVQNGNVVQTSFVFRGGLFIDSDVTTSASPPPLVVPPPAPFPPPPPPGTVSFLRAKVYDSTLTALSGRTVTLSNGDTDSGATDGTGTVNFTSVNAGTGLIATVTLGGGETCQASAEWSGGSALSNTNAVSFDSVANNWAEAVFVIDTGSGDPPVGGGNELRTDGGAVRLPVADFSDLSVSGSDISATIDGQTRTVTIPGGAPGAYSTVSVVGTVTYSTAGDCNKVLLVSNGGIANTINLPAAATAGSGAWFRIKDTAGTAGTGNITIDPNGSETIDGAATLVLNVNYQAVMLVCNGTGWGIH